LNEATIDWEFLKTKLQYKGRWQPLYCTEFHHFLESLPLIPKPYKQELRDEFLGAIDTWIHGSELNHLSGLDSFDYRDVIQGVTQQIEDLVLTHGNRLCVVQGEFHYSQTISSLTRVIELEELSKGDHLLLSLPFSNSGRLLYNMNHIFEKCQLVGAWLHIDCAWMGSCRDITFNFDRSCVMSVSFSLSKSLGLGAHRVGIRYTRNRPKGIITTLNDQHYLLDSPLWAGLEAMKQFGTDYLQKRYYSIYQKICEKYQLEETNTIFVAIDPSYQWLQGVGLRPVIRYIDERKW
jgi:hypothetical protein